MFFFFLCLAVGWGLVEIVIMNLNFSVLFQVAPTKYVRINIRICPYFSFIILI